MSFTKVPILFQKLCMKKLSISLKLFVSCKSTINLTSLRLDNFNSIFGYFFCHDRLGTHVSESLLDNQRESALSVVPEES